ncbi:uncharacterized protein CTRU02_210170 [Colletotrichum truncatum]|uniref:Uncharacterized protein n=1 Tax=Colletotrichum truncatum TaxID=5467 RepID=A0ACC3YUH1_COLTU|nr:uncharacterized protein CTRU02_15601 [Colletotrichum truncatum]KAF6780895.1 hypothetical protein CTRU02_15601 [Colletotrichum truncatum]
MAHSDTFLQIDASISVSHSGNPASLAYSTARTRWPKILKNIIVDVENTVQDVDSTNKIRDDGSALLAALQTVLDSMESDGRLQPIPNDGNEVIGSFNRELDFLGPMTWHNSPWLFTENYLYRLIHNCFARRETQFWKDYDPFAKQKANALKSSKSSIIELVHWVLDVNRKVNEKSLTAAEDLKAIMEEALQISLWGNAVDLLLLVHVSTEDLQSRQGKKARENFKKNVVDDDTEQVWELLAPLPARHPNNEIHIVLDNAGFEFLADLILVSHLLAAGYAEKVVLHGKDIPWFVSDVTAKDFDFLLETFETSGFSEPTTEEEQKWTAEFSAQLREYSRSGRLRYEAHSFWTTQHCYARMQTIAPDLWTQLCAADLVIFKGDLNYRKLVFDGLWPRTTSFRDAIGLLGKPLATGDMGMRILSLRTCKADTVVGLSPGKEKEIDPDATGQWTRNGEYAVISFCDNKGE